MQGDKCLPCLICKLDGRWGVFRVFACSRPRTWAELCGRDLCMANLTSFHQVPTPELVGQLLICGLFFLVVTRGLVSSKAVIIEFRYYLLFMIMMMTIMTGSRGACHMHRDSLALCYHQLFAPQLVRVYRPYACMCGGEHRSHLLWHSTLRLMYDWHTILLCFVIQHIDYFVELL